MVDNLSPYVVKMFFSFVTIDLTLSFLFDESDKLNIIIKLVKKILYYGFFYYIILNYKDLVFSTLFKGAVQLGNLASTGSLSSNVDFKAINKLGVELGDIAGGVLLAAGFSGLDYAGLESATTVGLMAICGYLLFFAMLYVQIITTFIKFHLTAGFAYILIPFAGFDKTNDIGSKALNGLFSQAIEIFVMIVLIKLTDSLDDFTWFHPEGNIKDTLFTRWMLILFLYNLITRAGSIASALLAGSIASLGIGASLQSSGGSKALGAFGVGNADMNRASRQNSEKKLNFKAGETGEGKSFGNIRGRQAGRAAYMAATKLGNKASDFLKRSGLKKGD